MKGENYHTEKDFRKNNKMELEVKGPLVFKPVNELFINAPDYC